MANNLEIILQVTNAYSDALSDASHMFDQMTDTMDQDAVKAQASWQDSLKNINQQAKDAATQMSENFGAIGKAALLVGGAIEAAGILSIKTWSSMGSEILELSEKTGVSTEALSEWKYIAEQSGATIGTVSMALKYMARDITDVTGGSSAAQKAFEDLGLTLAALKAMKPEDQFNTIVEAIANVKDPTEKAAYALAIFGRSGTDMLPMLASGAAGIEELKQKAQDLGIVMSEEAAKKAHAFEDALNDVKQSLVGVMGVIAETVMPVLLPLIKAFTDAVSWVGKFANANPILRDTIIGITAVLGALLLAVGIYVNTMASATAQTIIAIAKSILHVGALEAETVALGEEAVAQEAATVASRGATVALGGGGLLGILGPVGLAIGAVAAAAYGLPKLFDQLGKGVMNQDEALKILNMTLGEATAKYGNHERIMLAANEALKAQNITLDQYRAGLTNATIAQSSLNAQLTQFQQVLDDCNSRTQTLMDSVDAIVTKYEQENSAVGKLGITYEDVIKHAVDMGFSVDQITDILVTNKVAVGDARGAVDAFGFCLDDFKDKTDTTATSVSTLTDTITWLGRTEHDAAAANDPYVAAMNENKAATDAATQSLSAYLAQVQAAGAANAALLAGGAGSVKGQEWMMPAETVVGNLSQNIGAGTWAAGSGTWSDQAIAAAGQIFQKSGTSGETAFLTDFWNAISNALLVLPSDVERKAQVEGIVETWLAANVGSYQGGGVVPGPVGRPTLAVVHGGEEYLGTHGTGGAVYNLYMTIQGSVHSDNDLLDFIRRGFRLIGQRNGNVGLA